MIWQAVILDGCRVMRLIKESLWGLYKLDDRESYGPRECFAILGVPRGYVTMQIVVHECRVVTATYAHHSYCVNQTLGQHIASVHAVGFS